MGTRQRVRHEARGRAVRLRSLLLLAALAGLPPVTRAAAPEAEGPAPAALTAWHAYVAASERRIGAELAREGGPWLVFETLGPGVVPAARAALPRGEVFVHHMDPPPGAPQDASGALFHHWLGAVLVPGATVDEVLAFVQAYDRHARYYTDVMASRTLAHDGNRFHVFLKLQRSRFGVSAHYDTEHDVVYRRHDAVRASSRSSATRIAELDRAGTPLEREKPPGADRGYLWRLNSYWRFLQTRDGVIVECESVSLSRDIPFGLGFIVGPFVRSVPRDSLDRTLRDMRAGVAAARKDGGA